MTPTIPDGITIPYGPDGPGPSGRSTSTRRRLVMVGLAIAGVAGLVVLVVRPGPASRSGLAPQISLPDLTDPARTRSLTDLRGRPVLVNLFASWCVPCRRELPALQAASAAHPEIQFLGVDHQDSRRAALQLLQETGVTYPAVYDPKGITATAYRARGMPTTILLRPDGTIAAQHTGELDPAAIETLLTKLTAP